MIAKETLFLNVDRSKAVPEGHKDAKFLLVRAGQEIPDAEAEKWGVGSKKHEAPEDHPHAKPKK